MCLNINSMLGKLLIVNFYVIETNKCEIFPKFFQNNVLHNALWSLKISTYASNKIKLSVLKLNAITETDYNTHFYLLLKCQFRCKNANTWLNPKRLSSFSITFQEDGDWNFLHSRLGSVNRKNEEVCTFWSNNFEQTMERLVHWWSSGHRSEMRMERSRVWVEVTTKLFFI